MAVLHSIEEMQSADWVTWAMVKNFGKYIIDNYDKLHMIGDGNPFSEGLIDLFCLDSHSGVDDHTRYVLTMAHSHKLT